jgi:hypothetical protein
MSARDQDNALPLPGYDELPFGSLTARITSLDSDGLSRLILEVLRYRLGELEQGAEPTDGDPVRRRRRQSGRTKVPIRMKRVRRSPATPATPASRAAACPRKPRCTWTNAPRLGGSSIAPGLAAERAANWPPATLLGHLNLDTPALHRSLPGAGDRGAPALHRAAAHDPAVR